MIEKEKYYEILDSLGKHLNNASDLVNVVTIPYDDYFTSTGKMDSRKGGFAITLYISHSFVSPRKFVSIISDTFSRIDDWMEEWSDSIAFLDYKASSVGGDNPRIELKIVFDDMVESAKRLLLR